MFTSDDVIRMVGPSAVGPVTTKRLVSRGCAPPKTDPVDVRAIGLGLQIGAAFSSDACYANLLTSHLAARIVFLDSTNFHNLSWFARSLWNASGECMSLMSMNFCIQF